jgi:prepilin peptidase CpaA
MMLGLLLPVVLLRGLGAGDWKLMGALGAILGWRRVLLILLASVFLAGGLAIFLMFRQGRVKSTLKNLWELLRGFFFFGLQPHPEISLENPAASSVPFGAAAAVATVLCCGLALASR